MTSCVRRCATRSGAGRSCPCTRPARAVPALAVAPCAAARASTRGPSTVCTMPPPTRSRSSGGGRAGPTRTSASLPGRRPGSLCSTWTRATAAMRLWTPSRVTRARSRRRLSSRPEVGGGTSTSRTPAAVSGTVRRPSGRASMCGAMVATSLPLRRCTRAAVRTAGLWKPTSPVSRPCSLPLGPVASGRGLLRGLPTSLRGSVTTSSSGWPARSTTRERARRKCSTRSARRTFAADRRSRTPRLRPSHPVRAATPARSLWQATWVAPSCSPCQALHRRLWSGFGPTGWPSAR